MARWIISDVDGCLSPEESIPWDLEKLMRLAELTRATSEGQSTLAPMTLCTGRPQPYVEVLMKLLDIPPGRAVGEALDFLLEIRLDEGVIGVEQAERRLREWWAARRTA
jgi:hypothetical protein